jgi:hypothetical protein
MRIYLGLGECVAALIYKSFPVTGVEDAGDDLRVVGRCSDGDLDHDGDVVSPTWMNQAVKDWLATYPAVRLQHRGDYPVGKGLEAWQDDTGATWVKSLVVDAAAQKMVRSGVLAAYSVGIAEPQTRQSVKARRWEIYGGRLAEVSLVDSPSNSRCGIQVVAKSAGGSLEYVGKAWKKSDRDRKAEKHLRKAAKLLGVPVPDPVVNEAHQALYDDPAAYRAWLAKQAAPGPALDGVAAMFLNSTAPYLREMLSEALSGGYGQQG